MGLAGGGVDSVGDDLAGVVDAGGRLDLVGGPGRHEVAEVLPGAAAVEELSAGLDRGLSAALERWRAGGARPGEDLC